MVLLAYRMAYHESLGIETNMSAPQTEPPAEKGHVPDLLRNLVRSVADAGGDESRKYLHQIEKTHIEWAGTPLTGLTDDERELLRDWWNEETTIGVESVFPVVARIIRKRERALMVDIPADVIAAYRRGIAEAQADAEVTTPPIPTTGREADDA